MISSVFDDNIKPTGSICGRKILAYMHAYGTKYSFCRFFCADSGGYILLYNSVMVLDGNFNIGELEDFIQMISPYAVEMSSELPLQFDDSYRRHDVLLYKYAGEDSGKDLSDVRINEGYDEAFDILRESFGMNSFSAWYTDLSHRVRHGVSKLYLYKSTTATMFFDVDGAVFLTHVATAASDRGKGTAGTLIKWLCGDFVRQGKEVYLYCTNELRTFYEHLGFVFVKKEVFFNVKS